MKHQGKNFTDEGLLAQIIKRGTQAAYSTLCWTNLELPRFLTAVTIGSMTLWDVRWLMDVSEQHVSP
jgi:hypothetical protein